MRSRLIGIALAALVLTASAYADAVFLPGNNPQPEEENVLFHKPDQTGTTVHGFTNHSDTQVNFTSTEILTAKGGQSDVDAATGFIHDITISLANPALDFKDLIIDPQIVNANNDITVTVHLTDGITRTDTFGRIHGNNFLTIVATGSEEIGSVDIVSPSGFNDLKQTRISGITGVTIIPEPAPMLLLGSGVLVLAQGLRRKLL